MTNNIDFSIIRERALRNIREDLVTEWANTYPAKDIQETFDAVKAEHKNNAVIEDFVPVLVEAEMKERLRTRDLDIPA
ncbi:three-helix bundle dimerization domain-containing protein [Corynebacterium sanguinis]